jgi:hypothetical protein
MFLCNAAGTMESRLTQADAQPQSTVLVESYDAFKCINSDYRLSLNLR